MASISELVTINDEGWRGEVVHNLFACYFPQESTGYRLWYYQVGKRKCDD